jgi:hypothetical protein
MSRLDQLLSYSKPPKIEPRGYETTLPWVSSDSYMRLCTQYFIHFENYTDLLTQDQILRIVFSLVVWPPKEDRCRD